MAGLRTRTFDDCNTSITSHGNPSIYSNLSNGLLFINYRISSIYSAGKGFPPLMNSAIDVSYIYACNHSGTFSFTCETAISSVRSYKYEENNTLGSTF